MFFRTVSPIQFCLFLTNSDCVYVPKTLLWSNIYPKSFVPTSTTHFFHFHRHSTSPLWTEFCVWVPVRGLTLLSLQNGFELLVQVHLRPNLLLYEYSTEWALSIAVHAWDLLKEVTIIFINTTIVWPQVKSREGTQLHPLTENWIKDLLRMARPSEQDPVFPSVSLSHQEASISLLSFFIRGRTDWKPKSQNTNHLITWTTACGLTQWNYKPCSVGPPKMDRSWWRVLTKCSPLEKEMANHFSILALRTLWTV